MIDLAAGISAEWRIDALAVGLFECALSVSAADQGREGTPIHICCGANKHDRLRLSAIARRRTHTTTEGATW
jgi:hypothetical protein